MDMEQELIDLLAQAAAFLPAWGWGVVGLAVGGCVLAKALMPAPTDASSSVYRAVYRVVTCVPGAVRNAVRADEKPFHAEDRPVRWETVAGSSCW